MNPGSNFHLRFIFQHLLFVEYQHSFYRERDEAVLVQRVLLDDNLFWDLILSSELMDSSTSWIFYFVEMSG